MTLRKLLVTPKDPIPMEKRSRCVYQIKCSDCPKSYIGQTGRQLSQRIKEHQSTAPSRNPSAVYEPFWHTSLHWLDNIKNPYSGRQGIPTSSTRGHPDQTTHTTTQPRPGTRDSVLVLFIGSTKGQLRSTVRSTDVTPFTTSISLELWRRCVHHTEILR